MLDGSLKIYTIDSIDKDIKGLIVEAVNAKN
jgi:hypothetical protein